MHPIVQVGNPKLREPCTKYNANDITQDSTVNDIKQLKKQLIDISGVGLAAPQVGIQKQLFVIHIAPTKFRPNLPNIPMYAVINPVITYYDDVKAYEYEGCFSVAQAGLFAKVCRPQTIKVTYTNEQAKLVSKTLSGIEAVVFQHEYDHLQGRVFLDCDVKLDTCMSASEYIAMRKEQA